MIGALHVDMRIWRGTYVADNPRVPRPVVDTQIFVAFYTGSFRNTYCIQYTRQGVSL